METRKQSGEVRLFGETFHLNRQLTSTRGIFQGLRLGGDDDGWDALSIAYEACLDPKRFVIALLIFICMK